MNAESMFVVPSFINLRWLILGASLVVGTLVLGVPIALWWQRGHSSSKYTAARMERRSRRGDGFATRRDMRRSAGRSAVRRRMNVLMPSTRGLSRWQRWQVPTLALATPLARVGSQQIWSPVEDVTIRVGGPRTGKSGEIACRILDAPGAVIATSTRTDLLELTAGVRRRIGPVWVFNPSGLARLQSTIVFDPLIGCEHAPTATARATDLISGVDALTADGGADRAFWQGQAIRVLSGLLHAAALGGASMRDVQRWASSPDEYAAVVQRYLRQSPEESIRIDVWQFVTTNDRTRSSITSTIMPAFAWLNDANAAAAAGQTPPQRGCGGDASDDIPVGLDAMLPQTERAGFDVAELLRSRGAVYLLGAEDSQVAPLVCALTGHIARTARQLATEAPGGRLDPALTLCLDEAALICPIPLEKWTADMGGRNITIHIAVQSRAQLRQRWGDTGAAAILNNAATLIVFGGGRDADDYVAYSALAGERHEITATRDAAGRVTAQNTQRVPVLPPAQLAQLGFGTVVIFRRGMAPMIGKVVMGWQRRDVRRVARQDRRAERRAIAPELASVAEPPTPVHVESQAGRELSNLALERWPK